MLKNCTKSEKINSFSSSKVNIIKINQTKIRFTLNRWKLMHRHWMNISCDGRTKKFYSLEIDNVHLLRIVYFLCILHRLFLLGTFFRLLFVLGTVFLIRTASERMFLIRTAYVKYIENKQFSVNGHYLSLNYKISLCVRHKKCSFTDDTLISSGSS